MTGPKLGIGWRGQRRKGTGKKRRRYSGRESADEVGHQCRLETASHVVLQQRQGPTEQSGCGEEGEMGGQVSTPPDPENLSWRPGKQLGHVERHYIG